MTDNPLRRKAAYRLEVVAGYLAGDYSASMFAALYNAGDIFSYLSEETGPVDADDLHRWAEACTGAVV